MSSKRENKRQRKKKGAPMEGKSTNNPKKNPDPITGKPGAHPVGTGAGAAGGGLAGAAIGGVVGGPVGAAVGAAVGGVAGAVSGRGVAEAVNPTQEEAYWRENHPKQSYAGGRFTYEHYAPAYRTGYEGIMKYVGKKYEEIEEDLALDYEKHRVGSPFAMGRGAPCHTRCLGPREWRGFAARPHFAARAADSEL